MGTEEISSFTKFVVGLNKSRICLATVVLNKQHKYLKSSSDGKNVLLPLPKSIS